MTVIMEAKTPLKIDLITDMANIMRSELQELGYKVNLSDNREIMIFYFTTCNRIIKKRPRKVHESSCISVPPSRKIGYDALKERFEKGESLMPYLSKQIKGLKFQDKMLFDWDIHHFHLGDRIEADGFVKQHNELVYAIVEDDDVYFIDVLPHNHWSDKDLLEKVLSNWPHLLDTYRVSGTPIVNFDSKDVEQLRGANINLILTLSDGHGYMGRGMGLTTAGTSANATILTNDMTHNLKQLEKQVKERNTIETQYPLIFTLSREKEIIFLIEKTTGQKWPTFNFPSLLMKLY